MTDEVRQTGQTAAQLAGCAERAKAGERVAFIAPPSARRYAFDLAAATTQHDHVDAAQGELHYGVGRLHIFSQDDLRHRLQAWSGPVIVDHAVWITDPWAIETLGALQERYNLRERG